MLAGDDADDERALVERARTEPAAFAALYRRHVEAIHAFAHRRTGSRELAEDITSATFLRALEHFDRFRWRAGGLRPWLYRLAANEVADHHRRSARRRSHRNRGVARRFSVVAAPDDVGALVADRVDGDRETDAVRAALHRLRDRDALVLSLEYFTELDRPVAAAAAGLSPNAYGVALHRAKAALRAELVPADRTDRTPGDQP